MDDERKNFQKDTDRDFSEDGTKKYDVGSDSLSQEYKQDENNTNREELDDIKIKKMVRDEIKRNYKPKNNGLK
ncbi:MAG: hypothetical protein GX982_03435, partial [Tissierellia bacterium]|nr:hypothetical protein [Tissierellia bacterium]